jgi:hypothetical protein
MGIVFVLFIYTVIGLVLATVTGSVAAGVCAWAARGKRGVSWRAILIAFGFPFAWLVFCGVAFVGYAIFCGTVRDVDPGLGDWWQVPIGHGYALVMIDVTDVGSVQTPQNGELYRCVAGIGVKTDHAAVIEDIPRDAPDHYGLMLEYGGLNFPAYSLLDLRSGRKVDFKDRQKFLDAAAGVGIGVGDIVAPEVFYQRRRWSLADLLFPLLIVGVPGYCGYRLIRSFRERLREAPVLAMDGA